MATKAELEEENAQLRQQLEDAQGDGGAAAAEEARVAGYWEGRVAAAAEAAAILHEASGKHSPTVKRIRALGMR